MPIEINILGFNYAIEYPCDERTMNHPARILLDTHVIQIATGQIPSEEQSCILHEIIEAINHHLELDLDHGTVSRLETGLYQALTQNGVDLRPLLSTREAIYTKKKKP